MAVGGRIMKKITAIIALAFILGQCCPARDSQGNYWKAKDVRHRMFARANRMQDTSFRLPLYNINTGVILNVHWHSQPSGDGYYDNIGRLIRVEHGRLSMWEMVWDRGKWMPYFQCSYYLK